MLLNDQQSKRVIACLQQALHFFPIHRSEEALQKQSGRLRPPRKN
jgi:hypothetical protein